MADDDKQETRQVTAIIFLDRPAKPDAKRLKERFGEILPIGENVSQEENVAVIPCDGSMLIAGLVDTPLPEKHWREWADAAWWWPEAEEMMRQNQAHIIVSSTWDKSTRIDAHLKHMLIVREFVEQLCAIGVAWGNVLVSANQFAGEFHRFQTENILPVRVWVLIQLSGDGEGGTIVSTLGMNQFDLREIEANSAPMEPKDALEFVNNLAGYLLTNGPVINDGDTVGGSEEQRIRMRFAPSFREGHGEVYLLDFERKDGPDPLKPGDTFTKKFYGKLN